MLASSPLELVNIWYIYGKRDFAGVAKLRIWGWRLVLDCLDGPNGIIHMLTRRRQEVSQRQRCDDGRRGSEPEI